MRHVEFSEGKHDYETTPKNIKDYAAALNLNFTDHELRVSTLRELKRMAEGGGDKSAREGQYGKFSDNELKELRNELVFVHKWPEI